MERSLSQLTTKTLLPPVSTHGSKRKLAPDIVPYLLQHNSDIYYDLCCGGGAISLELLKHHIDPTHITMIDIGLWGLFWSTISQNRFSVSILDHYIQQIPLDPYAVKEYIESLVLSDPTHDTVYKFLLIQACNFGGKAIRLNTQHLWENISIKPYWTPKPTSVRQTPSTTFSIAPHKLVTRIHTILKFCHNIHAYHTSVHSYEYPHNSVVYIDPDYKNTYGYKYSVDISHVVENAYNAHLYISETIPLTYMSPYATAHPIRHNPSNTILNAKRSSTVHTEWLTYFPPLIL